MTTVHSSHLALAAEIHDRGVAVSDAIHVAQVAHFDGHGLPRKAATEQRASIVAQARAMRLRAEQITARLAYQATVLEAVAAECYPGQKVAQEVEGVVN